ncbi:MAG: methylmalonyl Co-A mutase-associated GTPase MeaB [Candidatus Bathyarchaeota archaeon]|nr:MAG: methylmalonyl Co-A mutase-associated GTPase MeaB [Candidatus Bathyarchaeota archaeon]
MLKGDKRATARLLSIVENGLPQAQEAISLLYPHTGNAHIVGITGPSGVGKSTLVEKLVGEIRKKDQTVGIVAVDPTSPFSGGAFLGDRIRMQSLSTDQGVFIRSMASRGNPGGVARATKDAVKILDAAGMDFVIVETVGAGQSEVEVMRIAEVVVVILAPGLGDEIQALKAGQMEIGDIFVVNKSDIESADRVVVDLKSTLAMKTTKDGWRPEVVKTIATTGAGVDELMEKILEHKEYVESTGSEKTRRRRVQNEIESILREKAAEHVMRLLEETIQFNEIVEAVGALKKDPYTAVDELLLNVTAKPKKEGEA